jgi:hypothetical protein
MACAWIEPVAGKRNQIVGQDVFAEPELDIRCGVSPA